MDSCSLGLIGNVLIGTGGSGADGVKGPVARLGRTRANVDSCCLPVLNGLAQFLTILAPAETLGGSRRTRGENAG
jgi:hypothetical protein